MESRNELISLVILRIFLGLIFLWAFFDKLLGLGFSTSHSYSWINKVSPTFYFLSNLSGSFSSVFHLIAGNIFIDWIFMLGLLGIGISLTFGFLTRASCIAGIIMLSLMYLSIFPPSQNPLIDEHIIYILILLVLFFSESKYIFSIDGLLLRRKRI